MAFDNWDATQEWLTYLSKHHRHNYAELGGALLNLVPELRSQLHELDEPNYHIGTSHANLFFQIDNKILLYISYWDGNYKIIPAEDDGSEPESVDFGEVIPAIRRYFGNALIHKNPK